MIEMLIELAILGILMAVGVPLNSDFDLFSTGEDGAYAPNVSAPQSRDDCLRADDGAFIGLAGDY